jgi:hypothetical protein
MSKITLRNNTTFLRMFYLLLKQFVFKQDIRSDIEVNQFFTTYSYGIFEIIHYKDRKKKKYYTKTDGLDKERVLRYMNKPIRRRFLHASINDKVNVTCFVNDHLTSFHSGNGITVEDLTNIMFISKHIIPDIADGNHYLKLIDNETLDEIVFDGNRSIILIKDE